MSYSPVGAAVGAVGATELGEAVGGSAVSHEARPPPSDYKGGHSCLVKMSIKTTKRRKYSCAGVTDATRHEPKLSIE